MVIRVCAFGLAERVHVMQFELQMNPVVQSASCIMQSCADESIANFTRRLLTLDRQSDLSQLCLMKKLGLRKKSLRAKSCESVRRLYKCHDRDCDLSYLFVRKYSLFALIAFYICTMIN